jgi:hypothetical protein
MTRFANRTRSNRLGRCPKILVALAMGVVAAAASAQECAAPPAGMVFWLTGDGDYDDHAGFHHGSASGEVAFVEGRVGSALRFDADADAVSTDTTGAEMVAVADTFTYEFWARPDATTPDCPESQSGNCSGTPQRFVIFPLHGGGGGTVAGVGVVVGTNAVCVAEHDAFHLPCLLRHETTISDWTHVAVVVESRQPRLYLDGQLVRIGLGSLRQHTYASWNVIGSGLSLGRFQGDLDEVSVYDRALGDEEIAAIFAAGGAGKCKAGCGGGGTGASDDAWDVTRGATVTASSQMHATGAVVDSFAQDSFGAQTAGAVEPGMTIFRDLAPDGTVHFVEWSTPAAFALHGFRLHAAHDEAPQQRAFRNFRLFAREAGAASYTTVYGSPVGVPYPDSGALLPNSRDLMRCPKLRPFAAQEFRAEFTQDGDFPGGPRVIELDGFGPDLLFADGFDPAG